MAQIVDFFSSSNIDFPGILVPWHRCGSNFVHLGFVASRFRREGTAGKHDHDSIMKASGMTSDSLPMG